MYFNGYEFFLRSSIHRAVAVVGRLSTLQLQEEIVVFKAYYYWDEFIININK